MRIIHTLILAFFPLLIDSEQSLTYKNIIENYCPPPFYYYKSWCYYIFPNLTLDWSSAYRLCRSIDKSTYLAYISNNDEMIDPLRDILINRERSKNIKSIWTNTTWGQQKRTVLSRNSKRLCRKIELKSNVKSGEIDMFRMPFTNCREKSSVMCRKELPLNIECRQPWASIYGICYYLDEYKRIVYIEDEERNTIQCQAWQGELFSSSKRENTILMPFLTYSLFGIRSNQLLTENFGGVSYSFENIIEDKCSLVSGDTFLSVALSQIRNDTKANCSTFNSYTFCRKNQTTTCQPPWFYDDGFCLYFSSKSSVDMASASIECSQNGGHLLYINNKQELFRLTTNLLSLTPFFKHRSLAGVWLALSYRAITSASDEYKTDFDWQWDLSVQSYLDNNWKSNEWRNYFQHRLSPYVVSAGDCAALIIDSKILEPIERTSCHGRRTVVCRKPFDNENKSFHKKANYDRFKRLENLTETTDYSRKMNNNSNITSSLNIIRSNFQRLNTTTYRLIVHMNESSISTMKNIVFTCKSKAILYEKIIDTHDFSSIMIVDMEQSSIEIEYEILFNYLHLSNFLNTTNSYVYLSCIENDPWKNLLFEIKHRYYIIRNQTKNNNYCLSKYKNSIFLSQICSLLIDHFRITENLILSINISSANDNECFHYGGQCIPELLISSTSMPFFDRNLTCSKGYICWFQGEQCGDNSFCIDRIRYPCSLSSHISNVTCSNSNHDCCTSSSDRPIDSSLLLSSTLTYQHWNILLPIYYFSFHGTSKWDKYFFYTWLNQDNDLSQDFVNDEFLFSCTSIFIESTLLLTHESCLPMHLINNDKRSILFSLIKKNEDRDDEEDYEKVALHIDTYQIYSPFQLIRLSFKHDFMSNNTFIKLNSMKLDSNKYSELYCVLVLNEYDVRQIRLINDFERQFIFYNNIALFAFVNSTMNNENDEQWSFSPIACIVNDQSIDWAIVGISGRKLKHKCKIVNQIQYCQMTFVYSTASIEF